MDGRPHLCSALSMWLVRIVSNSFNSVVSVFVKVPAGEATEQNVVPEGAAERSLAALHGLTEDLASLARAMEAKKKRLGARVALLESAD